MSSKYTARAVSVLLSAALLAGILAGCGQTAGSGQSGSAAQTPEPPVSVSTPEVSPSAGPTPEASVSASAPEGSGSTPAVSVSASAPEASPSAAVTPETTPEATQSAPPAPAISSTPEASASQPAATTSMMVDVTVLDVTDLADEAVALSDTPAIPISVTAVASGILTKTCADAIIDYSNTKDGYVMVKYTSASTVKLKAQVKGPTTTYTYNLTAQEWAAFPLSDGNGQYQITVYKNVSGTKYASVLSLTASVTMTDEFAPFLHSNQYVNFDAAPKTIAKAAELTKDISDPLKKVEAVYTYVVKSLTYDKALAATVQSGYLPDLDKVLEKKSGICFDYASLMTGMLRSQGVPCKLVVGYAGTAYHAWISVWTAESGWIDGVIYFDGTSWQRMDPTFASSANSSESIMAYIGDGTNYSAKYFY